MARAKMREATLLGLFFYVPLGYTLLARFFHRYADDLTVDVDEEFRLGKTSEPIVNLLVRQGCEVLAVCRCAADEECPRDGVIDFSVLISQGAVQGQTQQLAFIVANQGCVSSSGFVHSLNKTANSTLHTCKTVFQFHLIGFPPNFYHYYSHLFIPPRST